MPYSDPNDKGLPEYVKSLALAQREQWVGAWNGAFQDCVDTGDKDCEGRAFKAANAAVAEAKTEKKFKTMDGKKYYSQAFAIVGSQDSPATWKLPHHASGDRPHRDLSVDWSRLPLAVGAAATGQFRGEKMAATMEQRRKAANHLYSHYKQADREIPESLLQFLELQERGLYLVAPHGQLIAQGRKTAIAAGRRTDYSGPMVLVSGNVAYGVLELAEPERVSVLAFDKRFSEHRVTVRERNKWWPGRDKLWLYVIVDWKPYEETRKVKVPQGTRTFIKNVEFEEAYSHSDREGDMHYPIDFLVPFKDLGIAIDVLYVREQDLELITRKAAGAGLELRWSSKAPEGYVPLYDLEIRSMETVEEVSGMKLYVALDEGGYTFIGEAGKRLASALKSALGTIMAAKDIDKAKSAVRAALDIVGGEDEGKPEPEEEMTVAEVDGGECVSCLQSAMDALDKEDWKAALSAINKALKAGGVSNGQKKPKEEIAHVNPGPFVQPRSHWQEHGGRQVLVVNP